MTSPAATAFRAELDEHLADIIPQIIGMESLGNDRMTPETISALQQEDQDRVRRRGLIDAVLAAMSSLENDGFPEMEKGQVSGAIIDEMDRQVAAILRARKEFEVVSPASTIEFDEPTIATKPETP